MIQRAAEVGQNICKIGRTKHYDPRKRFSDYDPGVKCLILFEVENENSAEKKMLEDFKKNFYSLRGGGHGNETFCGNLNEMRRRFISVYQDFL